MKPSQVTVIEIRYMRFAQSILQPSTCVIKHLCSTRFVCIHASVTTRTVPRSIFIYTTLRHEYATITFGLGRWLLVQQRSSCRGAPCARKSTQRGG